MEPTTISLGVSILSGLLGGGLFGGKSPRDKALEDLQRRLTTYFPLLAKPSFTKEELASEISKMKQLASMSTDRLKTGYATNISEMMSAMGVPTGQPKASMYVSEMSPLDAALLKEQGTLDRFGVEMWNQIDAQTKDSILKALGLYSTAASEMSTSTSAQNSLLGFLSMMNLGSQAMKNIYSLGGKKDLWSLLFGSSMAQAAGGK